MDSTKKFIFTNMHGTYDSLEDVPPGMSVIGCYIDSSNTDNGESITKPLEKSKAPIRPIKKVIRNHETGQRDYIHATEQSEEPRTPVKQIKKVSFDVAPNAPKRPVKRALFCNDEYDDNSTNLFKYYCDLRPIEDQEDKLTNKEIKFISQLWCSGSYCKSKLIQTGWFITEDGWIACGVCDLNVIMVKSLPRDEANHREHRCGIRLCRECAISSSTNTYLYERFVPKTITELYNKRVAANSDTSELLFAKPTTEVFAHMTMADADGFRSPTFD